MVLHAHRGFAYLELLVVVVFVALLLAVMFGFSGKISKGLRKISLVTMILFHLQFLVGLAMLLLVSPFMDVVKNGGMGAIMKDSLLRFQYIEHPFSMLVAAVLMTIVNKQIKTNEYLKMGTFVLALVALALFIFAFPFGKLFG